METIRKIIFAGVVFILACKTADAQIPFLKTFQVDKERSEIRVQRIIKDRKGFIWLGTSEGLYKFNGIEFSKIASEFVRDSSVTALFEDSRQRIWVGFRQGKIATVENDLLTLFVPDGKLPKASIHQIIEDKDSSIWFATNGEGVYCYSGNKLKNFTSKDGLSDDYTYALAVTDDGNLWIGTDLGISICNFKGSKREIHVLASPEGLPDNIVRVLLPLSDNEMWIGMQDKGVCKYLINEKKFVVPELLQQWQYGQVNCILETENDLWIGTDDNGIVDYEISSDNSVRHLIKGDDIGLSKINDMIEDGELNVWIANNNQLVRSSGEQISFLSNFGDIKTGDEETSDKDQLKLVHSILYDHYGNLWFTPDQGLVKLNENSKPKNKISKYTITPRDALVDITALYEDSYGYLWIGTSGKGIFRMNILSGNFIKIKGDPRIEKASILSIAGKGDDLWFAGLDGVTKCRIENGDKENASLRFTEIDEVESFGKNYIYCIYIDSRDRVWFGTDGEGLIVYDQGKCTAYTVKDGLKSNVIYSVTEDPSGNIWFSTLKAGIYKYDGTKFQNYSVADGLSDLNIFSIASDKNGNIVIVNRHGIDVMEPSTGLFSYYDKGTGLGEINSDLNSISKDKYGNIWIGTETGIIKYHPYADDKIKQPVPVLRSVSVFQEDFDFTHANKLSYDQNNITFAYHGFWYSDPARVTYQYMLEGYNNTWISSRDRSITYPKLSPGKYTFRVRSSLNQNFNHANETSYQFVIAPPFWRKWWFFTIIWMFAALLLRYYIIRRERRIKHLDLLQKEKIEFQFETLRNQVNPHFLFNSFNTLIAIIEENPKTAVEYVERMSQFFRNIVTYREKDVIVLKEELALLDDYFFLQKKRYGDYLTLNIDIPKEILDTRYVPPLTLQLLMENAVKHNAISKEAMLHIEIFVNKFGKLVMRNNTNRKIKKAESSGMGLENIMSRFRLLSDRTVEIKSGEDFFEVAIPLLKEE